MTGFYEPGSLPAGPRRGVFSDLSSWLEVWSTAQYLFDECVVDKASAGWTPTGTTLLTIGSSCSRGNIG